MGIIDSITSAIGEGLAYVVSRVSLGRLTCDERTARKIGESIVIGLVAAIFLVLALLGVGT